MAQYRAAIIISVFLAIAAYTYFTGPHSPLRESKNISKVSPAKMDASRIKGNQDSQEVETSISNDSSSALPEVQKDKWLPAKTEEQDPVLYKVMAQSRNVERHFETKLKIALGDERLFEEYKKMKLEFTQKVGDQLKKSNNQGELEKFIVGYHNRLYEVLGRSSYEKYLRTMKDINDRAAKVKPKIVITF